jgi:plastocyanin
MAGLGLLMAALGPLLMFAAALIWGLDVSEDIPFFLGTAVIGIVGAFVVLRFPAVWARVVGLVAAILVGGALFWTMFGLFAPGSFFDFVPGLLVMPGAILAIVGSIAGIVATNRGKAAASPAEGEKKTVRTVLAVVGVLTVVSAVVTFMGQDDIDASEADLTVTLSDFEFDKASYTFEPGSTVLVKNDDPFLHTFTIEELDIDEVLTPGKDILVEVPEEGGDYVLFCQPHTSDPEDPSDDDMWADLTIQ